MSAGGQVSRRKSRTLFLVLLGLDLTALVLGGATMIMTAIPSAASGPRAPQSARVAAVPCVWLIFIDDLHLDFPATGRLKNLLRAVFDQLVQEGDLVGVVSTGPSSIAIDLTRDRGKLAAALDKSSGAALKPSEILTGPDLDSSENRYRAHVAFSTAYDVMKMLASVRSSRQAVIYISNGYYFDIWAGGVRMGAANPFTLKPRFPPTLKEVSLQHLRDEVAELCAQATRANTPIYAIDPRALSGPLRIDPKLDDAAWQRYWTTTRNSLRVISEQAGGFVVEDELESGLQRIVAATRR
jgi:hypothetical protein